MATAYGWVLEAVNARDALGRLVSGGGVIDPGAVRLLELVEGGAPLSVDIVGFGGGLAEFRARIDGSRTLASAYIDFDRLYVSVSGVRAGRCLNSFSRYSGQIVSLDEIDSLGYACGLATMMFGATVRSDRVVGFVHVFDNLLPVVRLVIGKLYVVNRREQGRDGNRLYGTRTSRS